MRLEKPVWERQKDTISRCLPTFSVAEKEYPMQAFGANDPTVCA